MGNLVLVLFFLSLLLDIVSAQSPPLDPAVTAGPGESFYPDPEGILTSLCDICGISINYCLHKISQEMVPCSRCFNAALAYLNSSIHLCSDSLQHTISSIIPNGLSYHKTRVETSRTAYGQSRRIAAAKNLSMLQVYSNWMRMPRLCSRVQCRNGWMDHIIREIDGRLLQQACTRDGMHQGKMAFLVTFQTVSRYIAVIVT